MKSSPKSNIALALLRIVPSAFLLTYGIPKLQKLISGDFQFADPIGIGETPSLFLAVIGEVLCPILLIVGFKTRWAAVPAAITMAVAGFIVHAADPLKVKEHAFLFLTFFVLIMLLGPGKYSVDKK